MTYYNGGWNGGYWGQTTFSDLQQEMRGTTPVLGRNKSITVKFEGDKAVTGKGEVTFPALDPSTTFDYATLRLLRGWVDSESALARFADVAFLQSKDGLKKNQPKLYEIFKAIESARVENEYTELYPGAGKNLAQLSDEMFKKGEGVWKEESDFYPTAIGMLSRNRMKGVWNDYECNRMGRHIDREKVEQWVDSIHGLKTTQESFELAQRILEAESSNPPPPGSGGEGETGEGEEKPSEAPPAKFTLDDIINDKINASKAEFKIEYGEDKDGAYIPYTTEFDTVLHWEKDKWPENIDAYTKAKDGMDAGLATAKRKLELMIQSTQKISYETMKERGRLNSKQLVAAYNGEPFVFKVKKDESDLDTAISICVDLSGSMSEDYKSRKAFLATIVLAELLHKIGVPFEITGFDASFDKMPNPDIKKVQGLGSAIYEYGRIDPLRTHQFKLFSDRFFDARKHLHRIGSLLGSGSNNVDGESITIAAKSLAKRPEKRRILFVLSDGFPHAHGNTGRQFTNLQRTVKDIEKRMEVVGVGLESTAVSKFYKTHIVINDAENLPLTMLKLLESKLLPGKAKGAQHAA